MQIPLVSKWINNQVQKRVDSSLIKIKSYSNSNISTFLPMLYGNSLFNSDASKAYTTNSDAYSVIKRIAKTAAMIPLIVYKVKDEKALKEYEWQTKQHNYSTQSLVKKQLLKARALEPVTEEHKLNKLLNNPNPYESQTEHREGIYIFRLSTGNAFVYTPFPDFGENKGKPIEMWTLPSQYMTLKTETGFPPKVTSYDLNMGGLMPIPPEEIMHLKYFNPDFGMNGEQLIGLNPLRAGIKILQRSNAEMDYSVNAFDNGGISGIVANESVDEATAEVLGKLKESFYKEATGVKNARKLLFQAGKIEYIPIGLGPVDMQLIESEKITFKKFCNLYGVSDILFNNSDASTESNVETMVKQLYINAALPEVYAYRDMLNSKIVPMFKERLYVDCDISGISELQEDMKRMADIFNSLPIMVPNFILDAFSYGKSEDPLMDKVYVKNGYTPIEDLNMDEPLDNSADDYQANNS